MARSKLSSVTNAIRVLKAFSSVEREWGVSDLARRLDLSTSTAHRLLTTLTDEKMLERDERSGRYRLGLAMIDLAAAVPRQLDLHEALLGPMTELRNATGETVQVAVLDGRHVVYIERLDSPNTLRTFLEIGRRNSAHCCGTGKALLAFLPPAELDALLDGWELESKTDQTIRTTADLRRDLATVRRRRFAENRSESEVGVVSVAAPIRDASSRAIAAISVAGPAERMDRLQPELAHAVLRAAGTVSTRLGYRAGR